MAKTRTNRTFETHYDHMTNGGLCWVVVMTIPEERGINDQIVIARFMWERDADNFCYVAPMIWDDLGH